MPSSAPVGQVVFLRALWFLPTSDEWPAQYIEDIYFFEVNTKYISSNVLKISVISRVRSTSEIADIFNT